MVGSLTKNVRGLSLVSQPNSMGSSGQFFLFAGEMWRKMSFY